MNLQLPEWLKPAVWGGIVGTVAVAIIGLSAGWVVTSGSAEVQAERKAEQAVIAALTPICVAQFKRSTQEQRTTHLTALEEESSWQQGDYIAEHGWATMPGGKEPNDEVADACADALLTVTKKE